MSIMDVKRGTQTFGKSDGVAPSRGEVVHTSAATDMEKAYGDQAMGDVANRVANPNWVDPSKKIRSAGNPSLDKDAFMKMMLAQMKNQDPTNPQPSHEMAAQLAQFTSLEQLNNINSTLQQMKQSQSPGQNYQALALLGKKVSGDSSKLSRSAGDTKHAFNFDLKGDAQRIHVTVKDAGGNIVRKMDFGAMKSGPNSIEWNGMNDEGKPARAGEYRFLIDGQGANGMKLYAKTTFEGRITGLSYGSDGPVLMVGKQTVKLGDVKKIEDAGPEDGMPAIPLGAGMNPMAALAPTQTPMQPLPVAPKAPLAAEKPQAPAQQATATPAKPKAQASSAPKKNDVEVAPAPPEEEIAQGNIMDVPMAREMLNKVTKAVAN